jgi:hypothetical protein
MELQLIATPELYAGAMLWPWERASEILHAWRAWTVDAPETVTTSARIVQVPPLPDIPELLRGRQFVVIDGAVLGSDTHANEVLAPLRALEPEIDMFAAAPPIALSYLHMDPEESVGGIGDHALLRDVTPELIDAMVDVAGHESRSSLTAVELRHLGGALSRTVAGAGARSQIDAPYVYFAVGVPMTPELGTAISATLAQLRGALAPWKADGAYLNFAEEPTDVSTAFDDETYRGLQAVKAKYDSHNTIHANHEVKPAAQ